MLLAHIKDVVTHAFCYGYQVASFKVFSSETIYTIVEAAERTRALVILAINTSSVTFVDHMVKLAAAESVAQRASVPVAIELISNQYDSLELTSMRSETDVSFAFSGNQSRSSMIATYPAVVEMRARGYAVETWFSPESL